MTLLDYPGKIAALIFTQGCNFACGYCHNPEMIPKIRILPSTTECNPQWILEFLKSRKGLLDGVVISGGEPTLQNGLLEFMQDIKNLGFLIKLDTNGSNPRIIAELIEKNMVDYIAMDLKHSKKKYERLVKNKSTHEILQSVALIMNSGIEYEFRSTILPSCHGKEDIHDMGRMIRGAKNWFLQNFRALKTLDRKLEKEISFNSNELKSFLLIAKQYVGSAEIRNDSLVTTL